MILITDMFIYGTNSVTQEVQLGREPSAVEVFMAGHKGKDPNNLDLLCSQTQTERLVSYGSLRLD